MKDFDAKTFPGVTQCCNTQQKILLFFKCSSLLLLSRVCVCGIKGSVCVSSQCSCLTPLPHYRYTVRGHKYKMVSTVFTYIHIHVHTHTHNIYSLFLNAKYLYC